MGRPALATLSPQKLRELGAELHEITASLKTPAPGHKRRWFQGGLYVDLFVDFEHDQLSRWELTFESQWLAVERRVATTGFTDEMDASGLKPESKLITKDEFASSEVVAAAREVLSGLPDAELRDALLATLP